jgi:hypothetical protein
VAPGWVPGLGPEPTATFQSTVPLPCMACMRPRSVCSALCPRTELSFTVQVHPSIASGGPFALHPATRHPTLSLAGALKSSSLPLLPKAHEYHSAPIALTALLPLLRSPTGEPATLFSHVDTRVTRLCNPTASPSLDPSRRARFVGRTHAPFQRVTAARSVPTHALGQLQMRRAHHVFIFWKTQEPGERLPSLHVAAIGILIPVFRA